MSGPGVPVPLSQYIVKVHSRCDLACDHCYVYEGADQSWRVRPRTMPGEVLSRAAQRISEYARGQQLPAVQVVLHGGEPLLAGRAALRRAATELRSALSGVCQLDLRIHTNGVLLDEKFCELFAEQGIKVGISLDGGRAANDRHRRYADGRSSYDKVIRAIGLLRSARFRDLYAGLLCTIDVRNDPLAVYEDLLALEPPRIDFLLPHATWDHPPPRPPGSPAPYADWLAAIFDRWLADGRPVAIRTFESILSTLAGGERLTEALGLGPAPLAVIETDGSYEQVDSLKVAFDGAPATGLDVFQHTLDAVGRHPGILARQGGLAGLCRTCRECPVVASCGGGLYTHRYRAADGFGNPSVYCDDLFRLITHIGRRAPAGASGGQPAPRHMLAGGDFQALAAGLGGAAVVAQLAAGQRSLRRGLLGAVYQAGSTSPAVPAVVKDTLRTAWNCLAALDSSAPGALEGVLSHPFVRVWAAHCLEQLRPRGGNAAGDHPASPQPPAGPGRDLPADLCHLGAIAAAAAITAGASAELAVPVLAVPGAGAAVHLPTLGRLMLAGLADGRPGPAAGPATAAVAVSGDSVTIRLPAGSVTLSAASLTAESGESPGGGPRPAGAAPAGWQPVRMLRAPGFCAALDDTDPYRDCHQWQAAPRLSEPEFARWQGVFLAAWQEIERRHGAYAPAIAAGLTTVVPLLPGQGRAAGAAARQAFGAVAAVLPGDPVALALLLIQEFQQVKLGAVLDLYDLYDPADGRLPAAPGGDDAPGGDRAQPLEGLLQGTYAQLAVTHFWRARQETSVGPAAETASERFRYWHSNASDGIAALASSGSLTPLGERFVAGMRESIGA